MRIVLALPLLALAACNVTKDPANGQTTYEFNQQKVETAADRAGNTAEAVASNISDAAERAGDKIKAQVDNVHVDVDVNRKGK